MTVQQADSHDDIEKEWEAARGLIKDFDDRLDSLRKYGFTFVTALLTAQSLLIPFVSGTTSSMAVPDSVKFAIVSVTLILILTIKLIETGYQSFQQAASSRARVVETVLNLELTNVISSRYKAGHVKGLMTIVYLSLALGAATIGYFTISSPYSTYLIGFTALILALIVLLSYPGIGLNYEHGRADWTIDRLECAKDGQVLITLTNMDPTKEIVLAGGELLWEIRREGSTQSVHQEFAKNDLFLSPHNNITWIWRLSGQSEGKIDPGIYRIYPTQWNKRIKKRVVWGYHAGRDELAVPLRRKIIVEP